MTLTTATDAPTILVTGGSLTLRDVVIEESTGFTDAAISVTGGSVDLGTTDAPGGNILDVNGTGEFVHNTTGASIPAFGDTFEIERRAHRGAVPELHVPGQLEHDDGLRPGRDLDGHGPGQHDARLGHPHGQRGFLRREHQHRPGLRAPQRRQRVADDGRPGRGESPDPGVLQR